MSKFKKNGSDIVITARLPATREEWDKSLRVHTRYNINDRVHDYIREMIEDAKFRAYLDARTNKEAIEGKVVWDEARAAIMIQDRAIKEEDDFVANASMDEVVKAIRVALNRHTGGSRRSRVGAPELAAPEPAEAEAAASAS